ncbi:MAG: TonB-dependent receptor [Gammaproteobacteria bacterium]|nr:TonB-dependent receptor [Gammaproteobacteria bacterium]MCP5199156.1 TonB-dependent receptor [Gammaproteobacteria bacterium]
MSAAPFRHRALAAALFATGLGQFQAACADHDEIVVWGDPLTPFAADPGLAPLAETNTALLLKRVAGANVNFNGTLAGIAQYRGMYAERVNVDLDGMNVGNACSNNMDAPLHYLPRTFVDRLEVIRGIAPVSSGLETIGGTVIARSREAEFGDAEAFGISGQVAAGGQSVDGGYSTSGEIDLANAHHRFRAAASREAGNNRDFGDGTIRPTRYERNAFDAGYAFQRGDDVFNLDYRRNDTGETGTPALPMDDIYSDADLVRGGWHGHRGAAELSAELYWNGVEHLMSNYRMRRATPGRRRDNLAEADTLGWRTQAALPVRGGTLRVGADGHLLDYDSLITDPDNAMFFARNFDDVQRDRYGLYAEWEHLALGRWSVEAGLRWTHVSMDAGQVDASMAMMMPPLALLRNTFNASDRSQHDDNVDAALVVGYALQEGLTVEAGVARKNRSPSHQERYLWLPLEATGGLADGNLYVGDVNLDPETAWQFELGLDWRRPGFAVSPRAFYHHVDDYIQGIPATNPAVIMVGTMNGDPTPLQYANVDARLWGVDVEWTADLAGPWEVGGILSWVRGERRDIDDNLFRIAPLNTRVDLTYALERWSVTLEGELYAPQNDVSATNSETKSAGYGLLNLYGQYAWPALGLTFTAGVENVLDKTYRPHLNGINRVAGSDVALGARIPGDGVNGFVQVGWRF